MGSTVKVRTWLAAAVLACVGASWAFAPGVPEGTEKILETVDKPYKVEKPKTTEGPQKAEAIRAKLVDSWGKVAEGGDVLAICKHLPDLSADQKAQLKELIAARDKRRKELHALTQKEEGEVKLTKEEKLKRLAQLDKECNEAAIAVLTPAQREQLAAIQAATAKCQAVVAALSEKAGEKVTGIARGGAKLAPYLAALGLSDEQKKALKLLAHETRQALEQTVAAIPKPQDDADKQARHAYKLAVTEAHASARAGFEARALDLLTDGQKEELETLKKAVQAFLQEQAKARKALGEEVVAILDTGQE